MVERWSSRRKKLTVRVAATAALVASGVTVVGVVPALADDDDDRVAGVRVENRDRDRDRDDRFRGRKGDVRYVWFRICDTDDDGSTTSTATATVESVDTLADDSVAAAVAGATDALTSTGQDGSTTDVTTGATSTEETAGATSSVDETIEATSGTETSTADPAAEADYPAFVTIPLARDRARTLKAELRELDRDERREVCYDIDETAGNAVVFPDGTRLGLTLSGELADTATPTATVTDTATPTATVTDTATPTATVTDTVTPTSSASDTPAAIDVGGNG